MDEFLLTFILLEESLLFLTDKKNSFFVKLMAWLVCQQSNFCFVEFHFAPNTPPPHQCLQVLTISLQFLSLFVENSLTLDVSL